MREPPPITISDPRRGVAPLAGHGRQATADEQSRDGAPPARARSVAAAALVVGALVGASAAVAVGGAGEGTPRTDARPLLAVVTDHDVALQRETGQPLGTVEVTLVNSGVSTVQVLGADIPGTGLSWTSDRRLEPDGQLDAVLADPSPCAAVADRPGSSQAALEVDVADGAASRRLSLALPAGFGTDYREDVLDRCGTPALSDALWVTSAGAEGSDGRRLRFPVALHSQTVEALELLDVTSTLEGTRAVLRTRAGEVVALPHALPGRSLVQLAQDDPLLEAHASPYVLELMVEDGGCAALRGQTVTVAFRYASADEALRTAHVFMALDLPELVAAAC